MKKIIVTAILLTFFAPSFNVTYGGLSADSNSELVRAEKMLDAVVANTSKRELRELQIVSIPDSDKKKVLEKKQALEKIKGYKDLISEVSVEEAVEDLESNGYEIDTNFKDLCLEIELYKKQYDSPDPKETVKYFFFFLRIVLSLKVRSVTMPFFIKTSSL